MNVTDIVYDLMGGFVWDISHEDIQDALDSGAMNVSELDELLQHCPNFECLTCGVLFCPYGEPLHFHHDGCPACSP